MDGLPQPTERPQPRPEPDDGLRNPREASHIFADVARFLPSWPDELEDTPTKRRQLLDRFERYLVQLRTDARSGHWSYDAAHHKHVAHVARALRAYHEGRCNDGC